VPSGVPGAQSNQPPTPATAPVNGPAANLQGAQGGTQGSVRRESTTSYEVDRTQRTTRNATGTVKRLSAAVVVNHRVVTDARGRTTSTPLTPEELEKLTALVEQGVGFKRDRGDSVRVINAPFRAEPAPKTEELPLWKQTWVVDMLRAAAMPAALIFVAPPPPPGANLDTVVDDTPLLPGQDGYTAGTPALPSPEHSRRLEEARQLAIDNPIAVAHVLRSMMNGEEAKA
jgi:flagellar M-ring protein FliF